MWGKKCLNCKKQKSIKRFSIHRRNKDGLEDVCKKCQREIRNRPKQYLSNKFTAILARVGKIGNYTDKKCNFSRVEFIKFGLNDYNFKQLYRTWKKNNYNRNLAPSVDRKNNQGDYTFTNIQFITQYENLIKDYNPDADRGQKTILCVETGKIYFGLRAAANEFNVTRPAIGAALRGVRKKAVGYHWKYLGR